MEKNFLLSSARKFDLNEENISQDLFFMLTKNFSKQINISSFKKVVLILRPLS